MQFAFSFRYILPALTNNIIIVHRFISRIFDKFAAHACCSCILLVHAAHACCSFCWCSCSCARHANISTATYVYNLQNAAVCARCILHPMLHSSVYQPRVLSNTSRWIMTPLLLSSVSIMSTLYKTSANIVTTPASDLMRLMLLMLLFLPSLSLSVSLSRCFAVSLYLCLSCLSVSLSLSISLYLCGCCFKCCLSVPPLLPAGCFFCCFFSGSLVLIAVYSVWVVIVKTRDVQCSIVHLVCYDAVYWWAADEFRCGRTAGCHNIFHRLYWWMIQHKLESSLVWDDAFLCRNLN